PAVPLCEPAALVQHNRVEGHRLKLSGITGIHQHQFFPLGGRIARTSLTSAGIALIGLILRRLARADLLSAVSRGRLGVCAVVLATLRTGLVLRRLARADFLGAVVIAALTLRRHARAHLIRTLKRVHLELA